MLFKRLQKLNLLMISVPTNKKGIMSIKLTCVNIRPKCVKTILKWVTVPIELSVNLPMDLKNSLIRYLLLKKHTELKNANHSGNQAYVVTVFGANFSIMSLNREKIENS